MSALSQRLAGNVVSKLATRSGNVGAEGDTPFLDFIDKWLEKLLPMLLDCASDPAKAASEARRPNRWTRFRLGMEIHQEFPGRHNREFRDDLFDSLIAAGRTVTDEEMAAHVAA